MKWIYAATSDVSISLHRMTYVGQLTQSHCGDISLVGGDRTKDIRLRELPAAVMRRYQVVIGPAT